MIQLQAILISTLVENRIPFAAFQDKIKVVKGEEFVGYGDDATIHSPWLITLQKEKEDPLGVLAVKSEEGGRRMLLFKTREDAESFVEKFNLLMSVDYITSTNDIFDYDN